VKFECLTKNLRPAASLSSTTDEMTSSEKDNQEPEKKIFNVLHVVSRLPLGGVENMLMKVVRGYDRDRFNPIICCMKEGGEVADSLKQSGFRVEILDKMQGHGFDWRTVIALYKFIKNENIHILRTHQYHANLYGRIAGLLAGVPVIIPSFHSRYVSPAEPKMHRRLLNSMLGHFSDALVAVSPAVYSDIIKYDKVDSSKIKVIYNGVKISDFSPDVPKAENRKKLNLPEDVFIIGSVGRLKEEKGHKFLIEAASRLENVCVALAGDGPLMDELKALADKFRVKCIFMGMMPPEKIPVFLKSLDVFCFPSLWEGFPTALIEAMAAGLPVVATDIPSNREIADDAGILVAASRKEDLAGPLKMLFEDRLLRDEMGRRAKEKIQKFSIENTVKTYQDLFNEILRKKGML